jgi:hypothetical protein
MLIRGDDFDDMTIECLELGVQVVKGAPNVLQFVQITEIFDDTPAFLGEKLTV